MRDLDSGKRQMIKKMGEYDAFVCVCVAFSIWHEKSFTIRRASIQLCDLSFQLET